MSTPPNNNTHFIIESHQETVFTDANGVSFQRDVDRKFDVHVRADATEVEETCDETLRELRQNQDLGSKSKAPHEPFDDHEEIHDNEPVIVK